MGLLAAKVWNFNEAFPLLHEGGGERRLGVFLLLRDYPQNVGTWLRHTLHMDSKVSKHSKSGSKYLLTAARRDWGDVLTRSGPQTTLGQELPGPDTPKC